MRLFKTILFVLVTATVTHAQSFKERLIQMRQEYDTLTKVHLRMSIRVFENERATAPFVEQIADIKRIHDNFRYQLGSTSMLMNEKYLIVADAASREIAYSNRSVKEQRRFFNTPMTFDLDSILNLYETPTTIERHGNFEHYVIEQKKSPIRRIDMFIDVTTNHVRKMEYRYTDNHYVVIDFPIFNIQPIFDKDTFHEKNFMIVDNGVFRASSSFRGYRVVMVDESSVFGQKTK